MHGFLVHHIPSNEQSADILTKPLVIEPFLGMHTKLIVIQLPLSLRENDKDDQACVGVVDKANPKIRSEGKAASANTTVIGSISLCM